VPFTVVTAGEPLATAVGNGNNVGMDWGVYDLRRTNAASQDANWLAGHTGQLDSHALCWLDLLEPAESQKVKQLPAGDGKNGKQSAYCA
jgi:hypothetical protein